MLRQNLAGVKSLQAPAGKQRPTTIPYALIILACASHAFAQDPAGAVRRPTPATLAAATAVPPAQVLSPRPEKPTAGDESIAFVDGQLTIHLVDTTMAEVLAKVANITGVNIEFPTGANDDRIPILELGPGPARQVLASLLGDSNFDYVIQSSGSDSTKIQSVLLMPREKKGSGGSSRIELARVAGSRFAREAEPPTVAEEPAAPAEPQAPPPPIVADPSNGNSVTANTQTDQTAPPPAVPDLSPTPFGQPVQTNVPKTFPVAVPSAMNEQSINLQLQQMYQQRVQMNQNPASFGGNR